MNKITIEPNKHIAFIIQPRSGSSVLRDYLSKLLNYGNAGELLNHNVTTVDIEIKNNEIVKWEHLDHNIPPSEDMTIDDLTLRSYNNLNTLTQLSEIKKYCIFTVLVRSFRERGSDILTKLKERNDIQFIRQERADVLYSILSIAMSVQTREFHNTDPNIIKKRELKRGKLNIDGIMYHLNMYVEERKLIKEYFSDIPVVYYEQFQMSPARMMDMFNGIPKKIISLSTSKFSENYKDREIITNIDEIEDLYEQFVNDHIEYFPQYSGEHQITIPAHQGRQPKILLSA
jgi:LPS sulfotransferase NodH